jgi:hypothetical protein
VDDYTDDMSEPAKAGFELYMGAGEGNLAKVARILGEPTATVRGWSHRYRWPERRRRLAGQVTADAVAAAALIAARQLTRNVRVAIKLRDDKTATPASRLAAIKWLSEVGGQASHVIDLPAAAESLSRASVAELAALAAAGDTARLVALAQGRALPASSSPAPAPASDLDVIDVDAYPV